MISEGVQISGSLVLSVMSAFNTYVTNFYGSFASSFFGFAQAITTIYVAFMAYKLLLGKTGETPAIDILVQLVIISFVASVAFSANTYLEWLYKPLTKTFAALSNYVVSFSELNNSKTIFDKIDSCLALLISSMDAKTPQDNFIINAGIYFKVYLAQFVLMFIVIALFAAFCCIYVISFGGITVLMAVGAIPMFLAAFKGTRHIFYAWLRTNITLGVTVVFASLIMSLIISGMESFLADWAATTIEKDGVFNPELIKAILMGLMGIALLLKSADLAAGVTSGQAGSTAGIAGMISGAAGAALSTANIVRLSRGVRGVGSGAAGVADAGRRAYSRLRGFSD